MKKQLTDSQVEIEIKKLQESPLVKLGMAEERLKRKRRNYLSMLKWYEKKGKELSDAGVTIEDLKRIDKEMSLWVMRKGKKSFQRII